VTKVEKLKRDVIAARAALADCRGGRVRSHAHLVRTRSDMGASLDAIERASADYNAAVNRVGLAFLEVEQLQAELLEVVLAEPLKP